MLNGEGAGCSREFHRANMAIYFVHSQILLTVSFAIQLLSVSRCECRMEPFHGRGAMLAFAGKRIKKSGFGTTVGGRENPKKLKRPNTMSINQPSSIFKDLLTPESRMEHIRNRIRSIDLSPMVQMRLRQPNKNTSDAVLEINPNAISVVDNFLGSSLINGMRQEAESLLPTMSPSQSTKWDEISQSVVPYEKLRVLSTQIEGGVEGYKKTPRLVEYIVTLTSTLIQRLNEILPDSYQLSATEQTNKLAVCLGDGSFYDKHIDNLGGEDLRKLTALLYLQPSGSHNGQPEYPNERCEDDPRGGYFRAYDVPNVDDVTSIAPRGDRLIMFWSDSLVHDVSPSFTPNGIVDRRWALTVWFVVAQDGSIRMTDDDIRLRHFNG